MRMILVVPRLRFDSLFSHGRSKFGHNGLRQVPRWTFGDQDTKGVETPLVAWTLQNVLPYQLHKDHDSTLECGETQWIINIIVFLVQPLHIKDRFCHTCWIQSRLKQPASKRIWGPIPSYQFDMIQILTDPARGSVATIEVCFDRT